MSEFPSAKKLRDIVGCLTAVLHVGELHARFCGGKCREEVAKEALELGSSELYHSRQASMTDTEIRSGNTSIYLSVYPIVLGTVGTPHDLATNIRHSSRSSALLTASLSSKPVQSRMLSSHRFLCLPLLLPPRTVPWRTVLASPEALVTRPYHFLLRLFEVGIHQGAQIQR